MKLSDRLSDPDSFNKGADANHRAVEALGGILAEIGFSVRKKSPREGTLRVYPKKQNKYPLLNPRFSNGRLEITVLSKADNAPLDAALASSRRIPGCGFTPMQSTTSDGYHYHGVFEIPVDSDEGLIASLREFHQLLIQLG